MKSFFLSAVILVFSPITGIAKEMPAKEFYRLEECYRVIDQVGIRYWPSLTGFRGPWVYVADGGQYLVNFPRKLAGFEDVQFAQHSSNVFKPLQIQWRNQGQITLDGEDETKTPVFVFNSISDDPKSIHFRNPVSYTASIEIIKKTVPLADTEDWMSLFLHEVFHQYQFSEKAVFDYYLKLKANGSWVNSNDLAKIYAEDKAFKDSLMKENAVLLKIRNTKDLKSKKGYLRVFFILRDQRRAQYTLKSKKNLAEIEAFWEIIEGGARYFEYGTFRIFKDLSPNPNLAKVDSLYGSNKRYRSTYSTSMMDDLQKDKKGSRYFYTTGFNLFLLLEELQPGFQKEMFASGPLFAEALLRKHLEK